MNKRLEQIVLDFLHDEDLTVPDIERLVGSLSIPETQDIFDTLTRKGLIERCGPTRYRIPERVTPNDIVGAGYEWNPTPEALRKKLEAMAEKMGGDVVLLTAAKYVKNGLW